jgi:hypothetical protein
MAVKLPDRAGRALEALLQPRHHRTPASSRASPIQGTRSECLLDPAADLSQIDPQAPEGLFVLIAEHLPAGRLAELRDELPLYRCGRHPDGGQNPARSAFRPAEQAEEQMLGAEPGVPQARGFLLRDNDGFPCLLGEPSELRHHSLPRPTR